MNEKELERVTGQQKLIRSPNWGGKREGAGRRTLPEDGKRKKYSFYLSDGEHRAVSDTLELYRSKLREKMNESNKK